MRRASRGLDTPAGTIGQEAAAEKMFEEFLNSIGLSKVDIDDIHRAHSNEASLPTQNMYSLLTAFSIFIQTKKRDKARAADGLLAKSTALAYFSQVVNMLRERYTISLDDSKRIAKIREKTASHIEERNLRANVQTNDAPGCTIEDLCVLVEFLVATADVATGLKFYSRRCATDYDVAYFWESCRHLLREEKQLSRAASGELFLHIARINTSVVQGVSIYKASNRWQQCMLHAFGLLFICYDEPSEYLFPLAPNFADSDLPGNKPYSQEEAVLYWGKLLDEDDDSAEPPQKKERKRSNIASYITEVIRDTLKLMPPAMSQTVTPNMTSHSIRRGAAAYANASPKLAIQWISTRGAWLLESLTKAFAYIVTTTNEDQSVAKVLAGYQAPDLPVATPSIRDLEQRLSDLEFGQLLTLRNELFRHVLGFQDTRFNVALDVIDATFASLLMHLDAVLASSSKSSSLAFANAVSGGAHLRNHWQAVNHAQVGSAVAGHDSLLSSTLENMLTQLVSINERLGRLEDVQAQLRALSVRDASAHAASEEALAGVELSVPPPAMATTLAGCLLNWYTNHIWQKVKGKKDQNKRAEAKAAVNIMMILYQKPFEIPQEPARNSAGGAAAYQAWKDSLWTLDQAMDTAVNEHLYSFDKKTPICKAASLRKRWKLLKTSHPAAVASLVAQYLRMKTNRQIVDACTPSTHLWDATDMAQAPSDALSTSPPPTLHAILPTAGIEPASRGQSLSLSR